MAKVPQEGVIHFAANHRPCVLEPRRFGRFACRLVAWREILAAQNLIGQDPSRYDGAGYGNMSCRVGPQSAPRGRRTMFITGTQTSGMRQIGLADFCVVTHYDYRSNRVDSYGERMPSSEAMTHGAIYDASPSTRFVFHAHCPILWEQASKLGLPCTESDVGYGTPEMALDVQRLFRETALFEGRVLAMAGHEDGVVSFGRTPHEAGQAMFGWLARAYESRCTALLRS